MDTSQEKLQEFVKWQFARNITNNYKNYLIILEDIRDNRYNINEETYLQLRKKILDNGNEAIREMEKIMENLEVSLKNFNYEKGKG